MCSGSGAGNATSGGASDFEFNYFPDGDGDAGFKAVVFTSVVVSVFCMVMGIIFSYFVATPTGATIVIFNVMAFLVAKVVEILREGKAI